MHTRTCTHIESQHYIFKNVPIFRWWVSQWIMGVVVLVEWRLTSDGGLQEVTKRLCMIMCASGLFLFTQGIHSFICVCVTFKCCKYVPMESCCWFGMMLLLWCCAYGWNGLDGAWMCTPDHDTWTMDPEAHANPTPAPAGLRSNPSTECIPPLLCSIPGGHSQKCP